MPSRSEQARRGATGTPAPKARATKPNQRRGRGRPPGAHSGTTREDILAAARQVMIDRGYGHASLRDVAERAGVDTALVSYYFGSKRALYDELMREVYEGIAAQIGEVVVGDFDDEVDRIRAFVHEAIEALSGDPYAPALITMQAAVYGLSNDHDGFVSGMRAISAMLMDKAGDELAPWVRESNPDYLVLAIGGACEFLFTGGPHILGYERARDIPQKVRRDYAAVVAEMIVAGVRRRDG